MNARQLPAGHEFHTMSEAEVATIVEWAAGEQWNPGLHDITVAHAYDPDAFIALRRDGEMIGGGSIFSYDGAFGFMGLFIVREDQRGHGLGTVLWHHRLERLSARLQPHATIGMDGVFAMVPFYEKGGFALSYRDLRFDGIATPSDDQGLVPLDTVPFEVLDTYDRLFAPAPRTEFLRSWVGVPGAHAAAVLDHGEVVGYAVLRPCRSGFRFGPVHADRPDVAHRLIHGLMARVAGQPVQLDVPEPNAAGLRIAAELGMTVSFGCARMYHGADPHLPIDRIYGVTSFEFG